MADNPWRVRTLEPWPTIGSPTWYPSAVFHRQIRPDSSPETTKPAPSGDDTKPTAIMLPPPATAGEVPNSSPVTGSHRYIAPLCPAPRRMGLPSGNSPTETAQMVQSSQVKSGRCCPVRAFHHSTPSSVPMASSTPPSESRTKAMSLQPDIPSSSHQSRSPVRMSQQLTSDPSDPEETRSGSPPPPDPRVTPTT